MSIKLPSMNVPGGVIIQAGGSTIGDELKMLVWLPVVPKPLTES